MNHKAQGTIEYLVIIAIVVVIALVVVGLLLQILGNFSGSNETASKISWQSAEPWAIVDWSASDNNITFVLKNNTSEILVLNSITAAGESKTHDNSVAPGGLTAAITIENAITCSSPNKYSISKEDITIDYNTTSIGKKIQYGVADIVGTC